MNIPYFSIITTAEQLIGICVMLLFITIMSYVAYIDVIINNKFPTKLETTLIIIISISISIFFFWLMVGDSAVWSKSIEL